VSIINGERVEIERGKWTLTRDAYPTRFPNTPKYLSSSAPKSRTRATRVSKSTKMRLAIDCSTQQEEPDIMATVESSGDSAKQSSKSQNIHGEYT
jgi:hypothetical protein